MSDFLKGKKLDKNVPIPLYFQLKELIITEIRSGQYEPDSLIPTEKELSDCFGISRTTVRQTMAELVSEGWLYRVKSKGTFISRQKIQQDFLQKLETFSQQMLRIGVEPSTEILEFKVVNATAEVAEKLNLHEGDKVFYLFRRRFGDKIPVVIVETYLPYEICRFIEDTDFTSSSLYDALAVNEQTRICCAKRLIEAVEATTRDAHYLNVRKGAPIQLTHTVGTNKEGDSIEYSIARYRGDMSSFQVSVYVDQP